jgi:hypothetical protein
MAAYLSDDWVRALDEALSGVVAPPETAGSGVAEPTPADGTAAAANCGGNAGSTDGGGTAGPTNGGGTTVQFEVVGGPGGDRAWHLQLGPTGARAVPGAVAAPTVTFTQPWATAMAVAQGRRSTQDALLAGEVRVGGDPTRLVPWRRAVQAAEASVARLNASTTYPGPARPTYEDEDEDQAGAGTA